MKGEKYIMYRSRAGLRVLLRLSTEKKGVAKWVEGILGTQTEDFTKKGPPPGVNTTLGRRGGKWAKQQEEWGERL